MSIVGSRITRGGRDWNVASVVRAGAGLRIILRGVDDSECKIVVAARPGTELRKATDLSALLAHPESRSFRDQAGELWRVELHRSRGAGTHQAGLLVFVSETGAKRARIEHDGLDGIGTFTDDDLAKLLLRARQAAVP